MIDSSKLEEVLSLAAQSCNDQLPSEGVERLEALLLDEPELQQHYLEFVELDTCLRRAYSRLARGLLPAEDVRDLYHSRGTILAAPQLRTQRPSRLAAAVLAVALLFYGSFVFIAWNIRADKSDRTSVSQRQSGPAGLAPDLNVETDAVATISRLSDCRWSQLPESLHARPTRIGQPLPTNFAATLEHGIAEVTFRGGAVVEFQAPCSIEIAGPGRAVLDSGRLTAYVPPRATGFVVATPQAVITDLGTEFAVEADSRQQTTEVHVRVGRVVLDRPSNAKSPSPGARLLEAGNALRIVGNGHAANIQPVPFGSNRFRQTTQRRPSGLLPVHAVIASSSWRNHYKPERTIDGSGLEPGPGEILRKNHNASPSLDARGGMWLSEEKETTAFISFDLGRVCTITGFHVWNYASLAYKNRIEDSDRGARQVDVYADVADAFPTRLVETFEFQRAVVPHSTTFVGETEWGADYNVAGTTYQFSTPLTARYIKFDIRSNHGDPEHVGLSEVRFIGQPVDRK